MIGWLYHWSDRRLRQIPPDASTVQKLEAPQACARALWYGRRQSRLFQRRLPSGVRPHKGWQWWCLTHECTEYVLNYVDAHPQFVRFFRSTRIPDESFFQTILANSEFVHTVSPGFAEGVITGNHYIRWSKDRGAASLAF